jgi:MOSC domain-containing protein YiiM
MTKVGTISSLFYSPSTGRTATEIFSLDSKGIIADKHYDKDIDRSVLITSLESYRLVESHGINVPFGALGENLLIDYNPYSLSAGSKLKIGTVILEISQHCTLCKSLTQLDAKLPKLLKNDRGIFSKVVKSGTISIDDDIYLLD